MDEHPNQGLTNSELIEYLELPDDILDALGTAQGDTYTAAANQFLSALCNKIVMQSVEDASFENPFKKYDGRPIRFGDTIENIFVEMPKGYKYDKDATDPFTRVNPSVKALYATINYEMQYETTIYDSLLRRAALSEYGFMNLIDTILAQLRKSMNIDEYFATIRMLNNEDLYADGFEEIEKDADATKTAAKVAERIVNVTSAFEHPMTANNKARVMNVTNKNDILLVIKYDLLNSINLDYLTGVFNLNKVDLIKNIITVDSFQVATDDEQAVSPLVGEDIDFIIIDTKGFDNHTALEDGGMIYNPKGKYTNHFMNLWKIISYKYFHNARAFKLVEAETTAEPATSEAVGG